MLKNRLFYSRNLVSGAILAGLCLILAGLALLSGAIAAPVYAQDDAAAQEPAYVGAHECRTCHRSFARPFAESPHALALQDTAADKTTILGDFSAGEDLRTLQLPNEDSARPVTVDDIVYAIGSGKYVQRYLVERGENDYLVLPVEWNTVEGKWQPFTLANQWPDPAYDFGPNCAYCHTTALDTTSYTWNDDGVLCEACHGPGSLHVEAADVVGDVMTLEQSTAVQNAINIGIDAQVCGQCHTRGTAPDGIHPYPIGYVPGGTLDESVFVPAEDAAHWWPTGNASQPNMQYLEWMSTLHGKSLVILQDKENANIECLSCHSVAYSRAEANLAETWVGGDPFNPQLLLYIIRQAGLSAEVDEQQLADQLLPVLNGLDLQPDAGLSYDELLALIMEKVGFNERDASPDQPLLPQVAPAILEHLRDAGSDNAELQRLIRQIMPMVLRQVMQSQADMLDANHAVDLEQFGVTCATCHDPHSTADYPNLLRDDAYTLCVDCHSSTNVGTNTVHHPVQEMYEGVTLVENIDGVPGTHFTIDGGPDCQTCHMPEVPVAGDETRISHTLDPILPGETIDMDVLQDTCTTCHADRIDAYGMQTLINDVQQSTQKRLDAIRAKITPDCGLWVHAAVDFVEGDGSLGIHNYAYTDKLLDSVEVAIGLQPVSADSADVPLCMNAVVVEAETARVEIKSDTVILGLTEAQVVLLVLGFVVAIASLLALLILFTRGTRWSKLLILLMLVLGVALIVSAFITPSSKPQIVTTGDDGYCAVCHSPDAAPYLLSNGTSLPMAVDVAGLAASVHGDSLEGGRMGCVDCHGKDVFPHTGLIPAGLNVFRVQMSSVCIDCHAADTEHYSEVVKRNISVGCADCHSAHYVTPASELPPIALP